MAARDEVLHEQVIRAHNDLQVIGDVSIRFAGVERLVYYPAGGTYRPENDAEHSYMLALSAVQLAATYHPELDTGLISQFCLVHDLPEVYAGDTPSYRLTDEEKAAKKEAEQKGVELLANELPDYLASLLLRYEAQEEPEARFVRFVDKLMPAIVHASAIEANRGPFLEYYNISSKEDLEENSRRRTVEVQEQFPEFKLLQILREMTSKTSTESFFPTH